MSPEWRLKAENIVAEDNLLKMKKLYRDRCVKEREWRDGKMTDEEVGAWMEEYKANMRRMGWDGKRVKDKGKEIDGDWLSDDEKAAGTRKKGV